MKKEIGFNRGDNSRLVDCSARTALTFPNISNPVNFRINLGKMYKLCRMTIARDTDYAEFTYDVYVSKTGGNGSWQSCVQNHKNIARIIEVQVFEA